ncbi:MAG: DUF748 domain-containing protein, partial [Burkholderiaceae bacterium]
MHLPTQNKWLRGMLWFISGVAVLWGVTWALVPAFVKHQLERAAGEQLGRNVTVGLIDFKPWTLELTVNDLAIASQDGHSPQFRLKRLFINAEMESLLRFAPVIETLRLEGPQITLTHLGGGKYDVDDLIARFAAPVDKEPSDPLRFAVFNLALTDGTIDFDDRSVGRKHALRGLTLGIPFLSNLESRRTVKVEPKLAFSFNGSRFDSSAQTTPFAQTRKTDATMELRDFDLAPYLAYLPATLPVRLQQGVLGADLTLAFEQLEKPTVRITGALQVTGIKVADAAGGPLLGLERTRLVLDDVRPLDRMAKLGALELTSPQLVLARNAAGQLNLKTAAVGTATAPMPAGAASGPVADHHDNDWKVELAKLVLTTGAISWSDATVAPPAEVSVSQFELEATKITWPITSPLEFQGSAVLAPQGQLKFGGTATDQLANVKLSLVGLPLDVAAPYLAQFLEPGLRGTVNTELTLAWKAPEVQVLVDSLELSGMVLSQRGAKAKSDLASVRRISIGQARIDTAQTSVTVGKLAIDQPRLTVVRSADKRWMFENWLKSAPLAAGTPLSAPSKSAAVAPRKSRPWTVLVTELALDGGAIGFEDNAQAKPVGFELAPLKLLAKDARMDGNKPIPVQLSARLRSARAEPAQIDFRGTLQRDPLVAQGNLVLAQIPVQVFEPYFGAGLNIELLRADASFKGDVRYADSTAGPALRLSGDTVLEEFRANTLAGGEGNLQLSEELLTWKSLNMRGVDVALTPGAATVVSVKETALSDFFARVIIFPDGRINLQNIVKSSTATASPPAPAAAASVATPAPALPVVASGREPVITVGPVSLINGKVFFSDRFVKPNYSANLSELTGKLGAFSSQAAQGPPQLADVELRGRAESTASLEILGKINPLAKPLALDIKGLVRDLELAPLSPYSVKYAGHGIERGKLSVDVAYLVLPDGQLTASNKVVLNQLTFGEKVDGAPASLPVKLAVALLADRNGVIDINLPISGSLNDPQFSLGPIIFKGIVNLIVKAITAPFSLLASALGGGGEELSVVAFAPGSATLQADARAGLDKVAKALTERPALKMTVVGTASLEVEREALKQERLQALLLVEKRRELVSAGNVTATAEAAGALILSEAEKPALLKEVYKRADIAKPRNALGLTQEISGTEMEALLLANLTVTEDSIRELALQRGVAVKDYLAGRQLPVERLFLGTAKPVAADAKWTP